MEFNLSSSDIVIVSRIIGYGYLRWTSTGSTTWKDVTSMVCIGNWLGQSDLVHSCVEPLLNSWISDCNVQLQVCDLSPKWGGDQSYIGHG